MDITFIIFCFLFQHSFDLIICLFLKPIYLKGEKYQLKGQISVESNSPDGGYVLPENVIVNIFNGEGILVDKTTAVLTSSSNDQTGNTVYEYSLWANLGEKLTFVPLDPR